MSSSRHDASLGAQSTTRARTELAFIDTALEDWQTLQAGMSDHVDVVLLPRDADGLTVMQHAAQARQGLQAIHVFSHGTEGALHLGNTRLDTDALAERAEAVAALGASLVAQGDILLYGCNVAAGRGDEFLSAFAHAAKASVAASFTQTGANARGGDWDLDWRSGNVHTRPLHVPGYAGVMAPPTLQNTFVYVNESQIVLEFESKLDESSPLSTQLFRADANDPEYGVGAIAVNGIVTLLTSVTVKGKLVTLDISPKTLAAGDIVSFHYEDAPGDNPSGVLQSRGGQDIATFTSEEIVSISRPLTTPTVSATGADVDFSAGDDPIDLFSGVVANTNDANQVFTSLTLTVTGVGNGYAENIQGAGLGVIELTSGVKAGLGAAANITATVSLTPTGQTSTATIVLTGLSHTDAELVALLDGLAYDNVAGSLLPDAIVAGDRVISITSVSDDGTSNSTSALTGVSATVTVQGASEATPPSVTLTAENTHVQTMSGNPTSSQDLFSGVTASVLDANQTFSGAVLRVYNVKDPTNEFVNIGGTLIALSTNLGTFANGAFSVTHADGVSTITLSDMALSDSDMATLLDQMSYRNMSPTAGFGFDGSRWEFTDTRSIVLASVTDSGATNNVTRIDAVSTVNISIQSSLLPQITVAPQHDTYTFTPGTPTSVTFVVNLTAPLVLMGTEFHLGVSAPPGWTISNLQLDGVAPMMTGLYLNGPHLLTFDVISSGVDTGGAFPLSVVSSYFGLQPPQATFIAGSTMMLVEPADPAPTLQSAIVDGTELVLTYDLALDAAHAPATGAFFVTVDNVQIAVTNVAVDAQTKTVTLTLASAVQPDQVVRVSYTDPTSSDDTYAIQSASGADAASLVNQVVVNESADTLAPVITQVSIPNQLAQVGDVVTVTIQVSPDSDTYTLGTSTVNGFALSNLTKVDNTTYTATFTVTAGGTAVAAGDNIAVSVVLIDSASNPSTAYVTPISQGNDRLDTNAPPTLAQITPVPTLIDTAGVDDFPTIFGVLQGVDPEGKTLTYGYGGSHTTGSFTVQGDPLGITYDIKSEATGGAVYVNSVTGHYAYEFDAALLNSIGAGTLQAHSRFTVSDGNRTVYQDLELNFTGANDSPILSTDVRFLPALDQNAASAQNAGTTIAALLASAGTVTDAEGNPLGIAITLLDNNHGTWQYALSGGGWLNIGPLSAANALLLSGADLVRFVPNAGYTGDVAQGLTFKAWDQTSGTHGSQADTTSGNSAFSVATATASVRVDAVPTLNATAVGGDVEAGTTPTTDLFADVLASTVEADQHFTALTLFVTGVSDSGEQLLLQGVALDLVSGAAVNLPNLGQAGGNAQVNVTASQGGLTISITGLWATDAQMSALIGSLTYQHTSTTPTLGDRVITLTGLTDDGGANGHAVLTPVSATVSIDDTTAPAIPTITSAALVNTTTPAISGTAEAGSTVTVSIGGATFTTVATGGVWSVNLATATPASGTLSLNANGNNPISVTATDASNNTSQVGEQTLVIDTNAPAQPAVTSQALANSTTPTLSGTAEAGSTVTVSIGGATYTTVATGGNWSLNLAQATPDAGTLALNPNGNNTVSVTATDAAGNTSDPSTQTLVIDTTAPTLPAITSAELAGSTTPTISGTAEAGSTVTVSIGGATFTTVATGGVWSVDLANATPATGTLALNANGNNPISVTATDKAGNTSDPGTQTLVIDTTAPAIPVITSAALANATTPAISGTAEAGSTVTVSLGGATFTTVATGGVWSVNLATATPTAGTLALNANGNNPISVTATDAANNTSQPGTQTLVIDTTAPGLPAVTSQALANSTTPTISGTAEAGSTVTVSIGGATYTTVATGGNWSLNLAQATPVAGILALNPNGNNTVSVTATDAAGNTSDPSTQTLVIDTTVPTLPAITSAGLAGSTTPTISGTAEAGSTVTVSIGGATFTTVATGGVWSVDLTNATPATGTLALNANGNNPISVTATDTAGNTSDPGTQTLVIDTTAPLSPAVTSQALANSTTPVISGTAEAGSTVTVSLGGATFTTVATGGVWSVDLATATPTSGTLVLDANGENDITVNATDPAGNTSEAGTQTLVIDTTLPVAPAITSDALVKSTTPTISGTAEAGSTITVSVGGATYSTVATGGVWSLDLATATPITGTLALNPNGDNTVSVTATDAAGNTSQAGTQTLAVDTTAPTLPVITSEALADSATPTLSGTAEPGATITVSVGGATFTVIAEQGAWHLDLATAVPSTGTLQLNTNGDNAVTVIAADAAGNLSEPATQTLVIDTTAPTEPTFTSEAITKNAVPVLSGTAEPGSTVLVSVGGATYTLVATDGVWELDLATAVPSVGTLTLDTNGSNTVSVTATDAAGNTSAAGTQTLVIDTTLPSAPTITSGSLTGARTPTLQGAAEAGSTVTVTVGGAVYVVEATNGTWMLPLGTATPQSGTLALNVNGSNAVTVTATDPAGNVSSAASQTLVIDSTPPGTPSLGITAGATGWTVAVTGLEAGGQWEYRLPGGEWTTGQGTSFTAPLQAFAAGTIEVRQIDAAGNLSTIARNSAALTPPIKDADGDGLDDDIEQGVPGMTGGAQGDGNGDGIPDIEQSDVTSLIWKQTPDGQTRYVTLTNDAKLTQVSVSTSSLAINTLPAALTLPLGALAFTVRNVPDSGIVNFSIFLDADVPVNGYWKQIDGQWVNLATAITEVGGKTRIDFSIEDGGKFDADGVRNGVIVDPGAPGWFDGNPFDTDGDQVPDRLELDLGLTVGVKDNDVFDRSDLFVMQLYRDALGREAEKGGLAYWQQQLDKGTLDHADLVQTVLANPEALTLDLLARLAFGLTGEAPSSEDLAAWRASLAQDTSLDSLADTFVTTTYGNVTNEAFVDLLYQDALGRGADAGGRAYWVSQLDQGQSRGDVALDVLHSAEFDAGHGDAVALAGVYTALLGRAIDTAGLAYWSAELDSGKSLDGVIVDIMGSTEYHDRFLPSDVA